MKKSDNTPLDTDKDVSSHIKARRKLLSKIVIGGGATGVTKLVPTEWTKPLIEHVILPAHATTSRSPLGNYSTGGLVPLSDSATPRFSDQLIADQGIDEDLLEYFIPDAQAMPNILITDTVVQIDATFSENQLALCTGGSIFGSEFFSHNGGTMIIDSGPIGSSSPLSLVGGHFTGINWDLDIAFANTNNTTVVSLSPSSVPCTVSK